MLFKKLITAHKLINLILFVPLLISLNAVAVVKTWTLAGNGNWNTGANWSGGTVPLLADSVIIGSSRTVTLDVNTQVTSLYILTGATLNATNKTLTTGNAGTGGLTIDGTYTSSVGSAPVQLFVGSYIQGTGLYSVPANLKFDIASSSVVTGVGALTNITFDGTTANAKIDLNGGSLTNYGTITLLLLSDFTSGTFINGTNARLNYNNNTSWPDNGAGAVALVATAAGNTVNFNCPSGGVNIDLPDNTSYQYLIIAGASTTTYVLNNSSNPLTINNNLTIQSGATLNAATNNKDITVIANWINNGTFIPGTRTVTFNGTTSTITGSATTAFNNLTISNTVTGHPSSMSVSGNWVNNGSYTHNNGIITFNGTTTVSGSSATSFNNITVSGVLTGHATTMNVLGTWTNNGTYTHNSGTVVLNGSSGQQTVSGTSATIYNNLTIANTSGITLGNNITINSTLALSSNVITTNAYTVILPATGILTRTTGFIRGKLQKNIATGASTRTFEVGTGTSYTPVDIVFASVTTAGNLLCSSTSGDSPDIFASDIDPNKSVNRYWSFTNSGVVFTTFSATFNFVAGDLDGGATTSNFRVQRYSPTSWNATTIGTLTATSSQITGATTFDRDFQIGELFNPAAVYNAAVSAINWSDATKWIQFRTGTITSSTGSTTITGTGTLFTTELAVGNNIMLQTTPGTVLGTIASIASNTSLTLTANASATATTSSYGRQAVPSTNDDVNIGNPNAATSAVTVTVDVDATIHELIFTSMAFSNNVTHNATMDLTVTSNVTINQPSGAFTNAWNINTAIGTVGGNLVLGSNVSTSTRIAKVAVTTGTLSVGTNLVLNAAGGSGDEVTSVIDLSGGAATLNLTGSFSLANGKGTLTPGTSGSIVNYNRTASGQTVVLGSAITYHNLHINNTHSSGATLSASITTSNVTGNLKVQSNGSKFSNGGFEIVGSGTKIFEVAAGATFNMTSGSDFPTGFGTFTFASTSTTEYHQNMNTAIGNTTYGNLYLQPTANNETFTFPAAATTIIMGDLVLGNGTYIAKIEGANASTTLVDIRGNLTIYPNATLYSLNIFSITLAKNWTNNGSFSAATKLVTFNSSTQNQTIGGTSITTFNNLTIANTSTGVTLATPTFVAGVFTLTSGLVTTDATNLLTISAGGAATSGSATSFVKGPMKKIGNTAFTFPIGKGTVWARLGISAPTNSTTEFVAEYFTAASPNPTNLPASGIAHVSKVEYWDLARPVGSSGIDNVYVTYYWQDADRSGITTLPDLIAVHYNILTNLWESKGGTTTGGVGAGVSGTITSTVLYSTFSPGGFGSAGGSNPLPIELVSFNAVLNSNKIVDIQWTTSSEINNDYFTVEKTKDGINFEELAIINGAGNSTSILNYATVDKNPFAGISYYRLKQTDFDGKFQYSKLVAINNVKNTDVSFTVFPNPATSGEQFYINLSPAPVGKEILVIVYDIGGNEAYSKVVVTSNDNTNVIAIDPSKKLAPGVYMIMGTSDQNIYKQKLIIY